MSTDVVFSPDSYNSAAQELQALAESFSSQTESFLDSVSDSSVLGINDKLGKHAHKIYEAAHLVGSIAAVALSFGMDWYADDLSQTAINYADVESNNAAAAHKMIAEEGLDY